MPTHLYTRYYEIVRESGYYRNEDASNLRPINGHEIGIRKQIQASGIAESLNKSRIQSVSVKCPDSSVGRALGF